MAKRADDSIIRAIRSVVAVEPTDRELLDRFVGGDEKAFATLVNRHSGMVLGVCRRVLRNVQDGEDAGQATFVVLARKAKGGRWQESIANWLYTTARRIASKVNRTTTRRRQRESLTVSSTTASPLDQMTGREAFSTLDEELDRLPAIYREPLVLCYLEGLTRDAAATRLGIPPATLKSQLDRGRKKLGDALLKRGVEFGAVLLAVAATSTAGASSPKLLVSILAAVGGSPSPAVAALAQGVILNGISTKVVLGIATLVALLGVGSLWSQIGEVAAPTKTGDAKPLVVSAEKPAAKDAITPAPEKVMILVLDADGEPVTGATIRRLSRSQSGSYAETVLGKTDTEGRFEAEVIPRSSFTAVADGIGVAWGGSASRGRELTLKMATPYPIKGRLTDLQGKPIAGAKVRIESVAAADNDNLTAAYNAYRANPEWVWSAFSRRLDGSMPGAPVGVTTDKDGRFELTTVGRNHVVHLRFQADGIESARVTVFADPEFAKRMKPPTDAEKKMNDFGRISKPAVYGPEFTHPARPEHVITGSVTDATSGKPVAGVKVAGTTSNLERSFSGSPWHDKVETVTDATGKFRLGGLVKAKKRFLQVMGGDAAPYLDRIVEVVDTEGYKPAVADVKLQSAVVVEGQLVNKATGKPVRGEAFWLPLNGNLTEEEKLLAGGRLYFDSPSGTRPSGAHAETGADGRFTLRIPRGPGLILARSDQFDSTAVFTPTLVREGDRKYLRKKETDVIGTKVGPQDRDDEESFNTFTLMWPLRWENGYAIIEPVAKAKSVAVKIEFDPGSTVTLDVTDPDGKPLEGVTLVGHGPYGQRLPTFPTAKIPVGGLNSKGRPVQLYLLHRERKLCAELKVKGDEKGPITVKMQRCGTATGRVVDHTGKPVRDAEVTFQMTEYKANDLLKQKLFRDSHTTTTDADGKFTFERMFPDVEFDLFVSLPGFRSGAAGSKRTTLEPGKTKDVGEFKFRDPKKMDEE
jgi:RNA polymerase sigma factor (sigma-70 family)